MKLELPRPSSPHLTSEAFERLRRGPLDHEARRAREHLALCPECSHEQFLWERFETARPLSSARLARAWRRFGSSPSPRTLQPWRMIAGLAASLAVLAAGVLWLSHSSRPDRFRGSRAAIELVAPAGTLAEPPREFVLSRETSSPARVAVFDSEHRYSWTSAPSREGRVPFPEEERRRLQRGVEYFWTVSTDEETLPARMFRVRPAP